MTAIVLIGIIVMCHIPLYWFAGYGMASWRESHPIARVKRGKR